MSTELKDKKDAAADRAGDAPDKQDAATAQAAGGKGEVQLSDETLRMLGGMVKEEFLAHNKS